ncbi:hypothetical protein BJX62DRAFT_233745 [Aspergillus germanicus]
MSTAANSLSRPIIIGLDFGTSGTSEHLDLFQYGTIFTPTPWPSGGSEQKVPTQIAYRFENPGQDALGQEDFVWGFRVRPGMTMSSWFKIFLQMDPSRTPHSDGTLDEAVRMGILRLPPGKTGVDVTADFLGRILETIHRVVCPNGVWRASP